MCCSIWGSIGINWNMLLYPRHLDIGKLECVVVFEALPTKGVNCNICGTLINSYIDLFTS